MSHYKKFSICDWDQESKALIEASLIFLPQVWGRFVELESPPGDDQGECHCVAEAAKKRTKDRKREIREQDAHWMAVVAAVASAIPDFPLTQDAWNQDPKPYTVDMLRLALWELNPGLYFQKWLINRARPDKTCQGLGKTVVPTPGHPSYPAGHAAQAYTVALLVGALFPTQPEIAMAALEKAERVAENRVIAGIHFPSDCEAGRQLALQFVPLLLQNVAFQDWLALAASEWVKPAGKRAAGRSKPGT